MKNAHDLDIIGKQISDGFVHDGVSLNEGLHKVGSDQGLNREQLQRVAEAANTETYLSLMKTAKENYVDFPLADFKEVHDSMTKTASHDLVEIDDYDLDYESNTNSPIDETGTFEKPASIEKNASDDKKEAITARETMKYLDEAAYESIMDIETHYTNLEKHAQQSILSDVPFNNIKEILKVASEVTHEPVVELLVERLSKYAPHVDLTKEASIEGKPNPDSDLYKEAQAIQDETIRYLKIEEAIDHYHKQYTDLIDGYDLPLVKEAGDVSRIIFHTGRLGGRSVKGVIDAAKKFPTLATGAFLYAVGRKTGKSKGKRAQGKVLSRRGAYKKNKAKIVSTYR